MTLPQILSIAVLVGMMALFLWGRFRYDVVAVMALLAAVAAGIVAPENAFSGFSDDIVIIVGSALVLSGAVQRSGVIEQLMRLLQKRVTRVRSQLLLLSASVGFGSALVKNIGALAMLMPAAFQMAKKSNSSPSVFLMPMAFGSLLGGLMTLIGTSPNIIVSARAGRDDGGEGFGMFDFAPVGLPRCRWSGWRLPALLATGLLPIPYRARPRRRWAMRSTSTNYISEARVAADPRAIGGETDEPTSSSISWNGNDDEVDDRPCSCSNVRPRTTPLARCDAAARGRYPAAGAATPDSAGAGSRRAAGSKLSRRSPRSCGTPAMADEVGAVEAVVGPESPRLVGLSGGVGWMLRRALSAST
jgi:hypothetical protein